MNMDETIQRINELARKQRAEGLGEEELAEQAELRRVYINNVKANLANQLDHMSVQEPDGTIRKVKKIK